MAAGEWCEKVRRRMAKNGQKQTAHAKSGSTSEEVRKRSNFKTSENRRKSAKTIRVLSGDRFLAIFLIHTEKEDQGVFHHPRLTERLKGGFVIKGGFGECILVPVFVPGEHANVPSFPFSFRGNIRMYPRSGFVPGEHLPKPPFWKTTLFKHQRFPE